MTLLTNFSANEDFFAVFWTGLTNMESANECFSGCAALTLSSKHERSGHSTREVQSTLDRFLTSALAKRQRPAAEEQETYLE